MCIYTHAHVFILYVYKYIYFNIYIYVHYTYVYMCIYCMGTCIFIYVRIICVYIHYRLKVWGLLEMSLFFKVKHCFFNKDNINHKYPLYIVNVVNDYSRWKCLVSNEISPEV